MPPLGLEVELALPEPHQLKSEGGLFLQSDKVELIEVDRETTLSVHTGSRGCLDCFGRRALQLIKEMRRWSEAPPLNPVESFSME